MSNLAAMSLTATNISITWNVTAAIFIENFEVVYNYTINTCTAPPGSSSMDTISDGTMRFHNLSGLNEDSEYTITVRAINSVGSTNATIVINTTTAGE